MGEQIYSINIESPEKLKCVQCGKSKKASEGKRGNNNDFYKSYGSNVYQGYNNFIPICKDCLEKLYNEYFTRYKKDDEGDDRLNLDEHYAEKKAIKRLCMLINIYYSDKAFNGSLNHRGLAFAAYMKVANLNQYKNKTYDDTLTDDLSAVIDEDVTVDDSTVCDTKKSKRISNKTIRFFGSGFSEDDYEFLQEQYSDWTTRHECNTKAQEEVFKQICFTQLELLKATRAKQDTKDLTATFQKLLETAKLQPKQNHADSMSDAQTFGTLIDKWENTRPLPEIDEELKDVDKIGLYIDVFFRGHLAKMMGMKNTFSNLYTKFMKKYTVEKPEYKDDEDSEALFDAIFGNQDI